MRKSSCYLLKKIRVTAQPKPWYKKWWGVIIAILLLPYFLLWFVWAKTKWTRFVKVGATIILIGLCVLDLAICLSWASSQPAQLASSKTAVTKKQSKPVPAQSEYANANQIVQTLKAHNVPCTNVIKDTGLSTFTGATSDVWIETAPGDSAAQFGGTANKGTDTEIVVFKNHVDAAAYANIPSGADTNHETILGTNWAIDAASPAVANIRKVLGGTIATRTPAATVKPATTATQIPTESIATLNTQSVAILSPVLTDFEQQMSQGQADADQSNAGDVSSAFHTWETAEQDKENVTNNDETTTAYNNADNAYYNAHQTAPNALSNWDSDAGDLPGDITEWANAEELVAEDNVTGSSSLSSDQQQASGDLQQYKTDLAAAETDISQL